MKHPVWSIEKLRQLSKPDLDSLRKNALRQNMSEVVQLCDLVLGELKPKTLVRKTQVQRKAADYVVEYHFVCRGDRGVTFLNDGTFKSASWVVAADEAKKSLSYGARFALHDTKQELSYRQGEIVGFERIDDFEDGSTKARIDFIVKSDEKPMKWAGFGTGEKGYLWNSEVRADDGD